MNKRIKDLAEQAAGGMLSYHAEGDWYLSENEVEKFAKLIVKECADNAENIVGDLSTYVNPQYVSRAIKKPFGVA